MSRLIIRTKRDGVVLKELIPTDAKRYFLLVDRDRPHLSQYDDPTAQKYPTKFSVLCSILSPRNPQKIRFGVWDGKTFVGMVGLTPRGKGVCETGGWTGREFCRRGYASVTRNALAQYAISRLGYKRVIAKTHPDNVASQGMLRKAGFRLVRRTEKNHYFAFVREPNPYQAFRQLQRVMPSIREDSDGW
jgi:RimJ/RimL family protein N-acetyltransferase